MIIIALPFQKCPEGVVHEDLFKDIYSKFFPHGSKCNGYYKYFIIILIPY